MSLLSKLVTISILLFAIQPHKGNSNVCSWVIIKVSEIHKVKGCVFFITTVKITSIFIPILFRDHRFVDDLVERKSLFTAHQWLAVYVVFLILSCCYPVVPFLGKEVQPPPPPLPVYYTPLIYLTCICLPLHVHIFGFLNNLRPFPSCLKLLFQSQALR